jgi:hypothetical protein
MMLKDFQLVYAPGAFGRELLSGDLREGMYVLIQNQDLEEAVLVRFWKFMDEFALFVHKPGKFIATKCRDDGTIVVMCEDGKEGLLKVWEFIDEEKPEG